MIKISAVIYINTKPFVYGIKNSGFLQNYRLELDIPSACADKLLAGKVDIGLIPVAIIPQLENPQILTNYCIGAVGAVRSVMLFSEVPLDQIKKIYLDHHSRTSVLLVQILAKKYWKINPLWIEAGKGFENNIKGSDAGVVIGDRALEMHNKFRYSYDLAEEWYKFTSLPFVFACWVANKPLPDVFVEQFGKATGWGVRNMERVLEEINKQDILSPITIQQTKDYLNNSISYELDAQKRKGMELFWKYVRELPSTYS
ncbi:MAG: menaquinone biosynthesis protein [Bacteroidota bacterium]